MHLVSDTTPQTTATVQCMPGKALAVIFQPSRSVMTSGKARSRDWKLRFERQSPPFIEPLMGWTGGDDTLAQVELSFPSLESAVEFARRNGLTYTVMGQAGRKYQGPRMIARATDADREQALARRRRIQWVEDMLGPKLIREGFGAGARPAAHYADPKQILRDKSLDHEQKRELLQRWALEAYLLDLAFSRDSRLQEIIDSLIELDGGTRTEAA
jgi:hypothetical protein